MRAKLYPLPSRAVDYDEEDVDDGEKAGEDGKDVKKCVCSLRGVRESAH